METKHPSLALESGTYCTCREMSSLVAFCNYGCCQTGVRVSFFYKQCFNAFSSHNFVFYLPCIYTHLKCCFFCLNLALTFPASLFFSHRLVVVLFKSDGVFLWRSCNYVMHSKIISGPLISKETLTAQTCFKCSLLWSKVKFDEGQGHCYSFIQKKMI